MYPVSRLADRADPPGRGRTILLSQTFTDRGTNTAPLTGNETWPGLLPGVPYRAVFFLIEEDCGCGTDISGGEDTEITIGTEELSAYRRKAYPAASSDMTIGVAMHGQA
jgi:hypothetical protein